MMKLHKTGSTLNRKVFNISQSRFTPEFKRLVFMLSTAALFALMIIVVEGIALWYFGGDDPKIQNVFDGIYYIVVSIFGETSAPISKGPRIITLLALFQGLILATYLIAITALFTIKGNRIMTRKHTDHILICGWNFQGITILEELVNARSDHNNFDIVVIPGKDISDEIKPLTREVFVLEGQPTDDEVLKDADINRAKSAIILTDTTLSASNADAKVLMITLAVETINPDVYTCAQLMNSENAVHLRRANVDELILFDVIGANLSVSSALTPGVTRIFSELIHFDENSELYKLTEIPKELIGKSFKEALIWFGRYDMILVAVESDEVTDSYTGAAYVRTINSKADHKGVSVNPSDHVLQHEDSLFLISDDSPAQKMKGIL